MNKQTFIQLIKNPSGISPDQVIELEKVIAGFPYCQAAYILIAKQTAETGSMLADQKLKKASAYTLDRKNLKKILTGKTELSPIKFRKDIQKTINALELPIEALPILKEEKTEIIDTFSQELNHKEVVKKIETSTIEKKKETKEPLTDKQRDDILKELQENLKRLHQNKIKAAWDEIPKEIELATEPITSVETEIKEEIPQLENKVFAIKEENQFLENKEFSFLLTPPIIIYPIRTEGEVVEIKETEEDTDLLLEYLDFLEEKRGIFRKNKKKEGAIIDKIIKDDPSIPKLDINNLPDTSVDLASKSITISKEPISENFAKILGLQGKKEKAIEIYEQLILKNPEKKPYFEALIEKLKNKI